MSDVVDLVERRRAREPGFRKDLVFDTDDPEFTRGFEAGRLDHRLSDPSLIELEGNYHRSNGEMLRRIAAARGFGVDITFPVGAPEWLFATFYRIEGP